MGGKHVIFAQIVKNIDALRGNLAKFSIKSKKKNLPI